MKTIPLTNGGAVLVDDEDYDILMTVHWQRSSYGYACRGVGPAARRGVLFMHREIVSAPKGMQVDHIDGNKLNNQRGNLRLVTNWQNQFNRKKTRGTTSRFKGVTRRRNNWEASIKFCRKTIFLGRFETEAEAARAYDAAAIWYFGQYARLNFPEESEPLRRVLERIQAALAA